MGSDRQELEDLVTTMKRAGAALRDAEIPFMLGGGLAAWARGGPRTDHDVDFFVRESDAERALDALVGTGMKPERPTEEWLLKAYDGEVLVDLIFRPSGCPIGPEHFERASELEVLGQKMPVASIDDVLVTKLLALTEQEPDFQSVLAMARRSGSRSIGGSCALARTGRRSPARSSRWPRSWESSIPQELSADS